MVVSVAVGTWAVAKVGWAELLFAGVLFPPGPGQRRTTCRSAVRNPLYDTDSCLILGAALLTRN